MSAPVVIGAATLCAPIPSMFSRVISARHEFEIIDGIIQRVPVFMMDHEAGLHRSVDGLPDNHCTQAPHIRIGDLGMSADTPRLVSTKRDRANRHLFRRLMSRLPLSCGREVDAFQSEIPRSLTMLERGRVRSVARSVFVADIPRLRNARKSRAGVPRPATRSGTETRGLLAVWLHREGCGTDFTRNFDVHVTSISVPAHTGNGTTGVDIEPSA